MACMYHRCNENRAITGLASVLSASRNKSAAKTVIPTNRHVGNSLAIRFPKNTDGVVFERANTHPKPERNRNISTPNRPNLEKNAVIPGIMQ